MLTYCPSQSLEDAISHSIGFVFAFAHDYVSMHQNASYILWQVTKNIETQFHFFYAC